MKNSTKRKANLLFSVLLCASIVTSCGKYNKYDDGEVIENTYSGNVSVTSSGSDPAADFEGSGNSGTYSFAWKNSAKSASLNFDITSPTGYVQIILNDKKGKEMLNQILYGGSSVDTYAGVSESGKKGTWKVTVILSNFSGDGSYSLHPGS